MSWSQRKMEFGWVKGRTCGERGGGGDYKVPKSFMEVRAGSREP